MYPSSGIREVETRLTLKAGATVVDRQLVYNSGDSPGTSTVPRSCTHTAQYAFDCVLLLCCVVLFVLCVAWILA